GTAQRPGRRVCAAPRHGAPGVPRRASRRTMAPVSLSRPARGLDIMIIDRETFTELAVHLKLASDAILKTARHLAVLSNAGSSAPALGLPLFTHLGPVQCSRVLRTRCALPMPPDPVGRLERSRARPPPLHSSRARPVLARAPHALRASDAPRPRRPARALS